MKKCPPGQYYCNQRKKCRNIPSGYHVGARGYLEQDDDNGKRLECKTKGIPYSPTHGEEWINHIEELRASFPHIEIKVA